MMPFPFFHHTNAVKGDAVINVTKINSNISYELKVQTSLASPPRVTSAGGKPSHTPWTSSNGKAVAMG